MYKIRFIFNSFFNIGYNKPTETPRNDYFQRSISSRRLPAATSQRSISSQRLPTATRRHEEWSDQLLTESKSKTEAANKERLTAINQQLSVYNQRITAKKQPERQRVAASSRSIDVVQPSSLSGWKEGKIDRY